MSSERKIRIGDILSRVERYRPDFNEDLLRHAYVFSANRHQGQVRQSGEDYLVHPLTVAWILAEMELVTKESFTIQREGILWPVIFVAALSMVNVVLRPIIRVLACPLNCLTMGLASIFIHALLFWLVGNRVPGLSFPSFISAFLASVLYSVLAGLIIWVTGESKSRRSR